MKIAVKKMRAFIPITTFVFMIIFARVAFASSFPASIPLSVKWDVGAKDSVVTQDFEIPSFRLNPIIGAKASVVFHDNSTDHSVERLKELENFTGDGSMYRVTKESANTDNPITIPEYTPEELEFLRNGGQLVGGSYYQTHPLGSNQRLKHEPPADAVWEYSKMGGGTVIAVHVTIERLQNGGAEQVFDKTIDTKGRYTGLAREILAQQLPHGNYRLTLRTLNDTTLPTDIETFLQIDPIYKYSW